MIFKPEAIVEIEKGLKFVVLDIKKYEGKEVALVQGVKDGVLRFAVEKIDPRCFCGNSHEFRIVSDYIHNRGIIRLEPYDLTLLTDPGPLNTSEQWVSNDCVCRTIVHIIPVQAARLENHAEFIRIEYCHITETIKTIQEKITRPVFRD